MNILDIVFMLRRTDGYYLLSFSLRRIDAGHNPCFKLKMNINPDSGWLSGEFLMKNNKIWWEKAYSSEMVITVNFDEDSGGWRLLPVMRDMWHTNVVSRRRVALQDFQRIPKAWTTQKLGNPRVKHTKDHMGLIQVWALVILGLNLVRSPKLIGPTMF